MMDDDDAVSFGFRNPRLIKNGKSDGVSQLAERQTTRNANHH
jgi:hypothetical protein